MVGTSAPWLFCVVCRSPPITFPYPPSTPQVTTVWLDSAELAGQINEVRTGVCVCECMCVQWLPVGRVVTLLSMYLLIIGMSLNWRLAGRKTSSLLTRTRTRTCRVCESERLHCDSLAPEVLPAIPKLDFLEFLPILRRVSQSTYTTVSPACRYSPACSYRHKQPATRPTTYIIGKLLASKYAHCTHSANLGAILLHWPLQVPLAPLITLFPRQPPSRLSTAECWKTSTSCCLLVSAPDC
ncbi:hypothetical protein GGR57DRAFT_413998 [Xylariaceae sp. FL1272]|nr:hypothetical protein GGR57DRAFT_413998 [Xylariaceae sp. FL1272]